MLAQEHREWARHIETHSRLTRVLAQIKRTTQPQAAARPASQRRGPAARPKTPRAHSPTTHHVVRCRSGLSQSAGRGLAWSDLASSPSGCCVLRDRVLGALTYCALRAATAQRDVVRSFCAWLRLNPAARGDAQGRGALHAKSRGCVIALRLRRSSVY